MSVPNRPVVARAQIDPKPTMTLKSEYSRSDPGPIETGETHTLLRGNSRLNAFNLAGAGMALLLGLGLFSFGKPWGVQLLGGLFVVIGLPMFWFAWKFFACPRLSLTDRELVVYMRSNYAKPFRVPLDVVEVFFIGQGAVSGTEPGQPKDYEGAVAANVIVRLAESATEWHQRDVHLLLGVWNDGYITVRGLFCENIDQEVLKRMNKQLLRRKRQLREQSSK